jgi:hypothetical protein
MHFNKKMLTAIKKNAYLTFFKDWAGPDQIEANFLVCRTNPTLKKWFLTIFIISI